MRYFVFVLFVSIFSGCIGTSMPRETAMLSAQLGPEIQETKRSQFALLNSWEKAKRDNVEILLHYSWVPVHIKNFLEQPIVKKAFEEEVCNDNAGKMDRALVLQEMIEDMQKDVAAKRDREYGKIEDLSSSLRYALDDHYGQIELMYNALNANVLSVQKGLEMEKKLREAIEKPINKIIPLDKARTGFDKLFKLGEE